MKTVITCGHPYSGFQLAYEAQVQAGLALAQPSRREAITAEELHDKILKVHDLDRHGLGVNAPLEPGRVWQDLAVDLFIGNIDQGDWGWADARSAWLLSFWKDLDPQTRFVLAYSTPEYAIGTALRDRLAGPYDVETILASWMSYHAGMLRFYNRNPERCLLVNVSTLNLDPKSFIETLNSRFKLKLNPVASADQGDLGKIPAIAATLARSISQDHVEATSLYRELESAADIGAPGAAASDADKRLALAEYSALLSLLDQTSADAHEYRERANRHEADLNKLADEVRLRTEQLTQSQQTCDQLTQQLTGLSGQHEKLERQLAEVQRNSEKERLRLGQENELLLSQLHQVQEELEEYFIRLQERSAQLAAEQTTVHELTQARDEQAKLATDRQAQIVKLTQARDEQAKLAADRQAQVQKLTQARDEQAKLATDRQAQVQKLTQARDDQAKLATDRQAQVEKLAQTQIEHERLKKQHSELTLTRNALESRLKDVDVAKSAKIAELAGENEILLVQLHQVQEELEHYFLQWQELSARSAASAGELKANTRSHTESPKRSELLIDFRDEIDGDNWYYAEHDGRWAGPGLVSTLRVPPLGGRRCEFALDVVDAMEPEILAGMEVSLNGRRLDAGIEGTGYPTVVRSSFAVTDGDRQPVWEFRFSFPGTVSPAERGSDDQRHLAVRIRSLKLRAGE
ncbi:MAG: hypothetical protein IAE88_17780 [Rhodobacteraceae bacterium]|nr:hypothetical protein [Paracoccaceae bacterium]